MNGKSEIFSPRLNEPQISNDKALLLQYHQNFGHISFYKLQTIAKQGVLPSKLAKCLIPLCSACLGGQMTKTKWRDKTKQNYKPNKASYPGEIVLVDMLVSPTPGLIAQMSLFLMKKRYKYATVYVDNYSRLGYVYLQPDSSVQTTLKGKLAWEQYAASQGVAIKSYHTDNGIFKANGWMDNCKQKQKSITFTGVNAHHQNRIAKRRIHLI